ncbi:MAG: hypothetical protein II248_00750 [Paludibacteraceae bacterium]|nr:hypothetical protein [Paludibacteraceae bacterium]
MTRRKDCAPDSPSFIAMLLRCMVTNEPEVVRVDWLLMEFFEAYDEWEVVLL